MPNDFNAFRKRAGGLKKDLPTPKQENMLVRWVSSPQVQRADPMHDLRIKDVGTPAPAKQAKGLRRTGQDHPKANLTDREVDRMRVMHEEYPVGHAQHLGYRQLGKIFGISRYTARNHCKYRRRS